MGDILSAEQVEQIGREAEEWPEEGGPARLARSHEALRAALAAAQAECGLWESLRNEQAVTIELLRAERDTLQARCATLTAALEHIAAGAQYPDGSLSLYDHFDAGVAWAQKIARAALAPPTPEDAP